LSSERLVPKMLLSVSVRNLLDSRIEEPGSDDHVETRIPADPRTVWLNALVKL